MTEGIGTWMSRLCADSIPQTALEHLQMLASEEGLWTSPTRCAPACIARLPQMAGVCFFEPCTLSQVQNSWDSETSWGKPAAVCRQLYLGDNELSEL